MESPSIPSDVSLKNDGRLVRWDDDIPFPTEWWESHHPVMFQSPTRKYGIYMMVYHIIPNKPGDVLHDVSNALAASIPSCSSHHQPSQHPLASLHPYTTASGVSRISPPSSSAWAVRSPSLRPWSAARPAATCAQPWSVCDCAIGTCPDKPMTRHESTG